MTDSRIEKLANILVDYSTGVKPGDRVAIETITVAEPLVRALYERVLERGGQPHILLHLPDEEQIFYARASEAQLDYTPVFQQMVTEQFDVYIRARAETNTRALNDVDPVRQSRYQKAYAPIRNSMLRRSAEKTMRWVLSQYPTQAYADEAGMTLEEYENFIYQACYAGPETLDPVENWQKVQKRQSRIIQRIEGHDRVTLRGPDVDLSLSIKGRTFLNSCGHHNMPDGEIYTGPVENTLNGWVRYTYPAIHQGRFVEGIELTFKDGRVVQASAKKNEAFLLKMIDSDPGARYVGEFAIGTNDQIQRFTSNILFDEKIGGTFHMALGTGYPETGSQNRSVIHWDMICDMRHDAEIAVDGEVVYRNGKFLF
ncbi:MAG: aminopeptidase [Omnitrophica WOR_2 bacterium]